MTLAEWARTVKEIDDQCCVICGRKNSDDRQLRLESHHVEKRSKHPERETDVSNGVCLCRVCHRRIHGTSFQDYCYPDEFMKADFTGTKPMRDGYVKGVYDENELRRKLQEYVRNRIVIDFDISDDLREKLIQYCKETGETVNGFIKRAIDETIIRDKSNDRQK